MRSSSKTAPDPGNDETREQQHHRRQNREAQHDYEVGAKRSCRQVWLDGIIFSIVFGWIATAALSTIASSS